MQSLISETCFILLPSAKYCVGSLVRFTKFSTICIYYLTSHYNVKCSSFIPPKCHCTSAHFLNTLIHLSHLGNCLKILFWWTAGWCICSDSWVAITMYWLLWYMARWDKCVTMLWGSCWTVLCQWKIEFLWPRECNILNIACSGVNELRQWSELRNSCNGFIIRTNKCTKYI